MTLWGREAYVIANDVGVRGLRLVFKAKKTANKDPNNLDLKIYNLAAATRSKMTAASVATGDNLAAGASSDEVRSLQRALAAHGFDPGPIDGAFGPATRSALLAFQQSAGLAADGVAGPRTKTALGLSTGKAPVILVAGHAGNSQVIYSGEVRTIDHVREGADWVTHIQSGDGEQAFGRFGASSFAPGAALADVVDELTKQMRISAVDAVAQLRRGDIAGGSKTFLQGFTSAGRSVRDLDKALKSAGIEWSIQDGALQLVPPGKATQERAFVLSADSGLIGSPDHGAPGKDGEPPILKAKCLLNGAITPARTIRLEAISRQGFYRVETVEHAGDTHGPEWTSSIEASAL